MNELHAILDAWRSRSDLDPGAVLATVVHVTGSAYRRPGARMLVLPDGRHIGGISGGCLEGELVKKARWFTESETPVVRIYDTSSDDDAVWEFGLGCNGVVQVMLERANSAGAARMLEFLDVNQRARRPAVVATVVHCASSALQIGDRLMVDEKLVAIGELSHSRLKAQVLDHASSAFVEKKSRLVHFSDADLFIEFVEPPLSVVIFGAGHDAAPLVNIAALLGWNITIADGRPAYARPERFPRAARVVAMQGDDLLRDVQIDEETVVVVMTHNFPMDVRLIPLILPKRPRYLGVLGPRTRAERLFDQHGLAIPSNVHAPVGLDIGCNTPETVALSIAADIQATLSQRNGNMLMFRNGAIHAPESEIGAAVLKTKLAMTRPSYCETMVGNNV